MFRWRLCVLHEKRRFWNAREHCATQTEPLLSHMETGKTVTACSNKWRFKNWVAVDGDGKMETAKASESMMRQCWKCAWYGSSDVDDTLVSGNRHAYGSEDRNPLVFICLFLTLEEQIRVSEPTSDSPRLHTIQCLKLCKNPWSEPDCWCRHFLLAGSAYN